jgi:hypothetical protein
MDRDADHPSERLDADPRLTDGSTDRSAHGPPGDDTLRFGCDECALQRTAHCSDCLVTYMCSEGDGTVVISLDDMRLVRRLQAGGLAPPLRHRPRRVC